jgi:hypothetical protein
MQGPGPQCEHLKADGSRCLARALPGKTLFVFHDPESAAATKRGRRAGGRAAVRKVVTLPADTPDLELRTAQAWLDLLGHTANQVRTGRLDVKVSNAVAYLASVALTGMKLGPLEEKMAAIEARLNARGSE